MPVQLNAPLCNFLFMMPESLFIYLSTDFFCWGGKRGAENAVPIFFIQLYYDLFCKQRLGWGLSEPLGGGKMPGP